MCLLNFAKEEIKFTKEADTHYRCWYFAQRFVKTPLWLLLLTFDRTFLLTFGRLTSSISPLLKSKNSHGLTYTTYSSNSTMIPSLENTTSTWRPSIVCWRSRSRELKNSRQKIPKDLRTVAVPSKALSSNYVKYDKAALTQVMINALSTKTVRS